MFINYALAKTGEISEVATAAGCPMCQWVWDIGGPFWGWAMMIGMFLIGVLVIVVLALLIVWLIKQIKK